MASNRRRLEDRLRNYRIVIHNVPPNEYFVRRQVIHELGNVAIEDWHVERVRNYTGWVPNASVMLPQRDAYVIVRYRERRR